MIISAAQMIMTYTPPVKQILTQEDLERFKGSATCHSLLLFLGNLNSSVKGLKLADPEIHVSETVSALIQVIEYLETMTHEFPAKDTGSRFGNPSFTAWFAAVGEVFSLQKSTISNYE